MSNLDLCKENMQKNGVTPPISMYMDGKIHRFDIQGDKAGSKNGWYVFPAGGDDSVCVYGSWKSGVKSTWSKRNRSTMSFKEKKAFDAKIEKMKEAHEKEQKRIYAECRKKALSIWDNATNEGRYSHPYVKRKSIKAYAARLARNGDLMIPLYSPKNVIQGLQYIKPDGTKRFLPGTKKQGSFLLMGKVSDEVDTIIICEGFATACSIHQATKLPVVVAFDAGNLKLVAEIWRQKLPDQKIIIACDDDHATKGNPGKTKGIAAAKAVDGYFVLPAFKDDKGKTDFNDMHVEQELSAVKSRILDKCIDVCDEPDDADDEDTWPEPLLFGNIDSPEIPCSVLPEKLARYCQAVTDNTQTPSGLSVMMALAAVSTCIQKRFRVSPYGDDYTEPVNIMSVTALDSASRKSAVKNAMTEPLTLWETEQAEALKEEISRVRHERDIILKTIDSIKSNASKLNTTDAERDDFMKEIERLEKSMPEEVIKPYLWMDDITPESMQTVLVENGERIGILSDEGGIFEVITGLYNNGKISINVILQAHAGSPVRVKRQGRSVMLDSPAMTFGLTVQPDIISDLASGNKARLRGNGMLARLLFCIPKSTVGARDVTKRIPIPEGVKAEYFDKIARLLKIKPKYNEHGKELPRLLTLSPEALKIWENYSQEIETKQGLDGEYYYIRDWTGKLPGATLRIAGLCHAVEHGTKVTEISKNTIKRAVKLARLLTDHAKIAFGMMGGDLAVSDAKNILEWIIRQNAGSFRRGDLHKALHGRFQKLDRLKLALKVLQERHIIGDPDAKQTGHRPAIVYKVNPMVLQGSKE